MKKLLVGWRSAWFFFWNELTIRRDLEYTYGEDGWLRVTSVGPPIVTIRSRFG